MKDCGRSFKRFLLPSFPRPESRVVIAGSSIVVIVNFTQDIIKIGAELNSA